MPDSFQPPVSGGPHDPYEKYRVSEIHKDKETKDALEGTETFQPKHFSAFFAYIILMFKKFFELFEQTTKQGLTASLQKEILEHLGFFKAALETLKTEDRSQDSLFLNNMAQLWHQLLEDSYSFRRDSVLATKIRTFIKKLQRYPEHHEHSIGYYLTEYAGQKWLPFPYMDMIRQLHKAHLKNMETSSLSTWTKDLDEMIQMIQKPTNKEEAKPDF